MRAESDPKQKQERGSQGEQMVKGERERGEERAFLHTDELR